MDNISISLSERGRDREVSEIRVDGVIDTLTASELEQVFDSLLRRGRYRIVIDLAGVDYISSAGWGIFISHIKDVRDNDGDVKLANMTSDVREIFELLEFDRVLQAYPSVEEAVGRFVSQSPEVSKKKRSVTSVAVVDELDVNQLSDNHTGSDLSGLFSSEANLEFFALQMLKNDPFVSISEIRREFTLKTEGRNSSWWGVFMILKRHRLLRRRSRFRYAWGRT